MNNSSFPLHQRGAVLPVALFILVIVTILVVSSVDTSSTGLRVAFNKQARVQAERVSMQTAETMMSDWRWFTPANQGVNFWAGLNNPAAATPIGVDISFPLDGTADISVTELQDLDGDGVTDRIQLAPIGGYQLSVTKPVCVGAEDDPLGYDTETGNAPQRIYWEFASTAVDTLTGASATTSHGVRMRMLKDSCTAAL